MDDWQIESQKRIDDATAVAGAINKALKDLKVSQISAYMAIIMINKSHIGNSPDIHRKAELCVDMIDRGGKPTDA